MAPPNDAAAPVQEAPRNPEVQRQQVAQDNATASLQAEYTSLQPPVPGSTTTGTGGETVNNVTGVRTDASGNVLADTSGVDGTNVGGDNNSEVAALAAAGLGAMAETLARWGITASSLDAGMRQALGLQPRPQDLAQLGFDANGDVNGDTNGNGTVDLASVPIEGNNGPSHHSGFENIDSDAVQQLVQNGEQVDAPPEGVVVATTGDENETATGNGDNNVVNPHTDGATTLVASTETPLTQDQVYTANPNEQPTLPVAQGPQAGEVVAAADPPTTGGPATVTASRSLGRAGAPDASQTLGDAALSARGPISDRQRQAIAREGDENPQARRPTSGYQAQRYQTAESQPVPHHEVTRDAEGNVTGAQFRDGPRTNEQMREQLGADWAANTDQGRQLDNFLNGLSPEQRAQTLANMVDLQTAMAGGDQAQRTQFNADMATFMGRGNLTAQQRVDTIGQMAAMGRREGIAGNTMQSSMITDANGADPARRAAAEANLRTALAGVADTVARPTDVNQARLDANGRQNHDGTGQCNGSVITEGLANENPEVYAARVREAAINGTYTGNDGFRALMPSSLMQPNQQQNFADSLFIGGQLNHYWQQRGQYFAAWDNSSGGFTEARYRYDASQAGTGNPFTQDYRGEGAGVGANEVAFMGINAGINRGEAGTANFVYARPEWLPAHNGRALQPGERLVTDANGIQRVAGDGVAVINNEQDLRQARMDRYNATGGRGTWGVAVVSSRDQALFGGPGGAGGGHVVSTYLDTNSIGTAREGAGGFMSDQYGLGRDRMVSDSTLFGAMAMDRPVTGGQGSPEWRRNQPNNPGVETPDQTRDRNNRENDPNRDKDKDPHKDDPNKKRDEGPHNTAGQRSGALFRQQALQARYDQLASQQFEAATSPEAFANLYQTNAIWSDLQNARNEVHRLTA